MSGDGDPGRGEGRASADARPSSPSELDLILRPDLDEVERLVEGLSGFGAEHSLPEALLHNIRICIDELVSNLIHYAFEGAEEGSIRIRVSRDAEAVRVEVSDDGQRFNPLEDGTPADLDATLSERRIGRLGILLVKSLSDEMTYRYSGGRNVVSLTHLLDA